MGDDDGGLARQGDLERRLDGALRFGIQMGGGFVQNDDIRRFQQQPRDGQPLLFAARETIATVTHQRVQF